MSKITAALVRSILEKYSSYEWTVQGFGMVRTKIADVGRIHIWDSRLRVPLVSDIHAHPWELTSNVISGELINQRFIAVDKPSDEGFLLPYMEQRIATGEGGGLIGEPVECWLIADEQVEFYIAGETYSQRKTELHRSIPQDDTVTLLQREQGPSLQETFVYWPRGTRWVSAEPRPATSAEVAMAVGYALARWSVG